MSFTIPGRRRSRHVLLTGVSVSALAAGGHALAASPRIFSPSWFAARVDASTAAGAAGSSLAGAVTQSATTSSNLATMARQLQRMQAMQQAAAASATVGTVPNGLVLGGLQPATGATPGSPLWTGATGPTSSTANGRAEITVTQTAPQAMLTWQTFNVGSKTDLIFNQSAGGAAASSWVVLNRVEDPAANPSTILGSITAPGKVFIINANGIVFGAGSHVNLGALIAATADISAAQFATGIYGAQNASGTGFVPSFTGAAPGSAVVVDQGASITTTTPTIATDAGGYVMLLAGAVTNKGEITTPSGQTVLASGEDFILRPGYSTTGNQTATVQGSQVATCFPYTAGTCAPLPSTSHSRLGDTINRGLITATLGDITLVGHNVTQGGVVLSTSSVNTRGTVHLLSSTDDATGNIILATGSVTSIEPDNSANTALDSERQSLIDLSTINGQPHTVGTGPRLDDVSTLPDLLDESRVEIVTGGFVQFDNASLTIAQGGQVAVQAGYRVWAGNGAALDVSGSSAAVLPATSNQLVVNVQGNELRDAPVNRDTGLIASNNVDLDLRDLLQVAAGTGGDSAARDYTEGGLLEVSGYLSNIGHTIDEWDAVAGTITLAGRSVISQPAASFNISGGAVTVQGGELAQSYLIGPGGQLYNANTAPANLLYTGVYDGLTVSNARFGTTQTYTNSLATPAEIYQSGYTYGRDAGKVIVQAPSAVLEGQIEGGVVNGADQTAARPASVTDGYALSQSTIAQPGTLDISGFDASNALISSPITISGDYVPVADSITPGMPLPDDLKNTVQLSATQLSAEQLGGFVAQAGTQTIDVTGPITLAPGGTLSLTGATVTVGANLTARGGRITIGDITTVNNALTSLVPHLALSGGVIVARNVTFDLRGEWTNAVLDPGNVAGEALVNGGNLSIDSVRGLQLPGGTVIDASSGGALLPGDKEKGGAGGNITLIGDDPDPVLGANPSQARVIVKALLRDAGVNGGGTFSLTAPDVLVGAPHTRVPAQTVLLDPATFRAGFSDYVINGFNGLTLAPGTALAVVEPVYSFSGPASVPADAPTGTDPSAVFPLLLLPLFEPDQATARLTQRKGASLAFISNHEPGVGDQGGGAIDLGAGAAIAVDPGQSVRIEAYGQITDDADITARGGSVALVNEEQSQVARAALDHALSLSIWVGGDATIDVAGLARTASDLQGRNYGIVTAGGTITLGSDVATDPAGGDLASDANIVVAQGAVLDADGATAEIDLLAGTTPQLTLEQPGPVTTDPIDVASSGGTINLRSYASINILGAIQAASGGPGAIGGTLSMVLEDPVFSGTNGVVPHVPNPLLTPRILTISQDAPPPLAGQPIAAGQELPQDAYGQATISQQQIAAGGFASLSLYSRDLLSFDGTVALSDAQSVQLNQGIITDTSRSGAVTINAPYVLLNGAYAPQSPSPGSVGISINDGSGYKPFEHTTEASFTVAAAQIDVSNAAQFGITETYALGTGGGPTGTRTLSQPGFAQITLHSTGDIRFLPGTQAPGSFAVADTSLTTRGDVTLQGAQVYPATGAVAAVLAGFNPYFAQPDELLADGSITILGDGSVPAIPYSVGGSLALDAGSIVQDGVLRAPEGTLSLGDVGKPSGAVALLNDAAYTYTVTLMPGSVTSVSLDGTTVPYGGTVDGVTYDYNGAPVGGFNPAIRLEGQVQTVDVGATLDMSGGGTLAGAGFITGRGGSVNTLASPFLQFDSATGSLAAPTLGQQPVYAILPGYGSGYAPVSPVELSGSFGSVPATGAQITIGAGVPGIAPGTYTLLPAYYALLPGAARVQLVGGYDTVPGATPIGAGSYALNATTGRADTALATRPSEVIVTTGAGVLLDSEFDQQSYSSFIEAQAAKFDTPRGDLPEDGKTLDLIFAATAADLTALDFAGQALFGAATGGNDGQATVGGQGAGGGALEITADGATPTKGFVSIEAPALDALKAPSLVIGGIVQRSPNVTTQEQFVGTVTQVQIRAGAVLRAPQIFLTAESFGRGSAPGAITVARGAKLTTINQGAAPFDTASSGLYYNANGYSVVALSNGPLIFTPEVGGIVADGAITIADGATLYTQGSLNFITSQSLTLGDSAHYGAQSLTVGVDTVNFVSNTAQQEIADGTLVLPSGFVLTQTLLGKLLAGNPAIGIPALQSLVLSANESVNFAGSVAIDTTTLQSFVLDTPAIYGYGTDTDTATISTGTLYWNGIESGFATSAAASALPGGYVANPAIAGIGTGTLAIDAQTIVLGYGPNTQPDDQTTLNRVIEGFAAVDLNASTSLTANNLGSLGVYETGGATEGATGSGGNLTITTPLLTGAAGSVDSITAGGTLAIAPGAGSAPSSATTGALGAEIDLAGAAITDSSTILLNAGRLTMNAATGGIAIGAGARVDLAGQSVALVDQTVDAGGGSLALNAAGGNITTDAASSIDVSATAAPAGSVSVAALAGSVDLAGTIAGGADTGQTGGAFSLRADTLAGGTNPFDSLNQILDAGAIHGSRSFELATGDILVDAIVQAQTISITADTGALTVTGTLDASGAAPGSIALAAGGDLTLGATALLDAHGAVLQADSTGAAIEAENRASVSLLTSAGTLVLDTGATIDVASANPSPLGQVILDAPRTTDGQAENGVAIAAAGSIDIIGAQTVVLYGSRTYTPTDANGTIQQQTGEPQTGEPQAGGPIAGAVSLDQIDADNTAFINAAGANAAFAAATAGIGAYDLRPADIIASSTASGGNLTVDGDLDFSTLRYGPAAGTAPGAGQAGLITLRAANNLVVNGSITDGFAAPPDAAANTPDDTGWVLLRDDPLGQTITLPTDLAAPITLKPFTIISTASPLALNYDIVIRGGTLAPDAVVPGNVVILRKIVIGAGGLVATGTILNPDGSVLATRGQLIPPGTIIQPLSTLGAGTVLPNAVQLVDSGQSPGGATLAANVAAPGNVVTVASLVIPAGGLTATGTILNPDGSVLAVGGTHIAGNTVIAAGSSLGEGVTLPVAATLANGTRWPAGALLSLLSSGQGQQVKLDKSVSIDGGAVIPGGSILKFPGHRRSEAVRTTSNGVQGLIYATASLLPPGSQSWSINLVAGANLASANLLAVQPAAARSGVAPNAADPDGSIVLADTHYTLPDTRNPTASFSVVRTGTGTLDLVAGGNIDEASLYGVYTAGTQTALGNGQDASFNPARATTADGTVLGATYDSENYNAVDAGQQASYPDHGGDVLVAALGDVTGDVVAKNGISDAATDSVGDWLWTQGGGGIGQSTSWWINFGSYVLPTNPGSTGKPLLTGFTGIGALGGGDVTVRSGGDAGEVGADDGTDDGISQSLVIAVASTGRVTTGGANGAEVLTGGGTLSVNVGGTWNPALQPSGTDGGTLTDMRGDIDSQAGQLGRIDLDYGLVSPSDPRAQSPFAAQDATSTNGIVVVPGDGSVTLDTMRDLVLAGAGDPTRQAEQARTAIAASYLPGSEASRYAGVTGFSLWTNATSISLLSAGGNLTPTTSVVDNPVSQASDAATDYRFVYPATLNAIAASGSVYYGANGDQTPTDLDESLELAPSATGELQLLAAQSIYGHGYAIDMSGAAVGTTALPNPFNPAYTDNLGNPFGTGSISNVLDDGGNNPSPDALFAFEADTPTTDLHAGDTVPARIYAAAGDLVNVQFGEVLNYLLDTPQTAYTWYLAAKPADIFAGQDIVSNGVIPQTSSAAAFPSANGYAASSFVTFPNQRGPIAGSEAVSSGSLLLNLSATDVSVVTAGRDILGSYFYIAGPGQLQIAAGRNIDQTADSSSVNNNLAFGVIKSIGPVIDAASADRNDGAGIAIVDGAGATGSDYTDFADLYFDPANQANLAIPLSEQPGKVQQTYQDQLFTWLQTSYGYAGTEADELPYYFSLPAANQDIFARTAFFDELLASGREESDSGSLFYKSYARGQTAIATLFPYADPTTGTPLIDPATGLAYYAGSITLDSGTIANITGAGGTPITFDSGISTLLGGDIQIISPGGSDILGTAGGPVPGASSGVITEGDGNIAIYALDSVLLGQSRIFTTFGGNIQIWSAQGDINAGRGSKTTLIVPPPVIAYDSFGDITLSPGVPTSGAGIATLAPIAGIAPGDVDLTAPLGTVDAGEAGIRVSGNLNISAAAIAGGLNISVGGARTGTGATTTVNVSAVAAAAAAAGSSTVAATSTATQRAAAEAVQTLPSIITVEIIGVSSNDTVRRRPAA